MDWRPRRPGGPERIDGRAWRVPPRLRPAILAVAVVLSSLTIGAAATVLRTPIDACFEPGWRSRPACRILGPTSALSLPDADDVWTAALVHQLERPEVPLPPDNASLVELNRASKPWLAWRRLSSIRHDLDRRDAFASEHRARGPGALEIADLTARSHRFDEIAAWKSIQPDPFSNRDAAAVVRARKSSVVAVLSALSAAILLLGLGLFRWQRSLPIELTAHALRIGSRRILLEDIVRLEAQPDGIRLFLESGEQVEVRSLPAAVRVELLRELDRLAVARAEKAHADAERRRLALRILERCRPPVPGDLHGPA